MLRMTRKMMIEIMKVEDEIFLLKDGFCMLDEMFRRGVADEKAKAA